MLAKMNDVRRRERISNEANAIVNKYKPPFGCLGRRIAKTSSNKEWAQSRMMKGCLVHFSQQFAVAFWHLIE